MFDDAVDDDEDINDNDNNVYVNFNNHVGDEDGENYDANDNCDDDDDVDEAQELGGDTMVPPHCTPHQFHFPRTAEPKIKTENGIFFGLNVS